MPRITSRQMTSNHVVSGDWCPSCGLYAYVNGEHRADCLRGHRGHHAGEPCTDRCDPQARSTGGDKAAQP